MTSNTQSQQHQPATSSTLLEPFYTDLLESTFPTSQAAIEFCRTLCAQYGFTVKQESSTHRNIYVYCSREGLPDSVRNPKRSPKRKRPSKRCDCKWRVVLNENKETHTWKFRKSNNPEAMIHNHSLMRPEEIERGWPKQVHDMICQLARERMTTQEIRQQVQAQFPHITWNERRFYNRLSEERQKIRQQETVERAHRLTAIWTKICMAAAGCDELTDYAQNNVLQLLHTICDMAQVSVDTLEKNVPILIADDPPPTTTSSDEPLSGASSPLSTSVSPTTVPVKIQQQEDEWTTSCDENNNNNNTNDMRRYSLPVSEPDVNMMKSVSRQGSWQAGVDISSSKLQQQQQAAQQQQQQEVPKNFTLVVIPKHAYLVKVHNQRSLNEMQIQRTHRRSRSIGPTEDGSDTHMRKQTKYHHHQQQQAQSQQHMMSMNNSTMPPPPSPHRSMMPPNQHQQPMQPQYQTTHHHHHHHPTMIYPPPPTTTYDHNTMSLPPTSTANYIQQQQQPPLNYTMTPHPSSSSQQPSSQECNDLTQPPPDDANIAFPPLDTSSSTVASTPSPVSAGTPPAATTSVIPFGNHGSMTGVAGTSSTSTTTSTTTTTTATSSNNSVDSPFMSIPQQQHHHHHRTKKSHRRHSYNNVHPSFQYPMMSPQTMYHQKQQVVGMSVVGNGRPADNRHPHQQQHRVPSSMPMAAPPPPPHQQPMMVSTVPEHGAPRPEQQIPCYGTNNGSFW
ncbi:hypothetical protein BDA99DRAFT_540356 [Phascolomyces articulosus]|uniref:FAR1 domain-containing protein n=1 Tax=Phascolomyces articulosus TaxID=60185 RepID=A0AAD5K505_9FUNG|nr:hypothetical protein BDA99DRAFT_540356 [Phascolomyces articulosus]